MNGLDRSSAMTPAIVWQVLGRRLAVAAGASTALVSLLVHNTLLTASIRGAIALVAVLLVVRAGRSALSRAAVSAAAGSKKGGAPERRSP